MFVPIIMGSRKDLAHAEAIASALADLGITSELRVGSAHKAAAHVMGLIERYEADPRPKVYVAIAGRSNALGAMIDGHVTAPVVNCPPYSDRFGGADIFSSLRMPSGIAPAVVLDPPNAALLVAKMFGISAPEVAERVKAVQLANRERLIEDDAELSAP